MTTEKKESPPAPWSPEIAKIDLQQALVDGGWKTRVCKSSGQQVSATVKQLSLRELSQWDEHARDDCGLLNFACEIEDATAEDLPWPEAEKLLEAANRLNFPGLTRIRERQQVALKQRFDAMNEMLEAMPEGARAAAIQKIGAAAGQSMTSPPPSSPAGGPESPGATSPITAPPNSLASTKPSSENTPAAT